MSRELPSLCEDLRNFLMTFVFITAESVRATQGQRGIMTMSVDMGSRLWHELEDRFLECAIQDLKPEGRIICFLEGLKKTGIIEDASFSCEEGRLKVAIKNCFFVRASNRQRREGLEYPLCPIGGLIVAGLHRNAGLLTTLEEIEHDPDSGVSTLTFNLYSPRAVL
ncbi:MAG: hypothetical protein QUS09_06175 [Methanotrichaceae archaeon]|nr:hypothetical protein [Methanotrichaceae archaeon]